MINECSIVRDILPLYLEDMVSEDTAAFIRQHLERCESCRKELEALKSDSDIADMTDEQTDEDKAALLALKKKLRRKKITTIAVTALCIIAAAALCVQFYFYMNISGKRLDNLDKLDEVPLRISVLCNDPYQTPGPVPQITLTAEQLRQLQELLSETTFKRRFTSLRPTEFRTADYYITADWDNDGLYERFVSISDNGYMAIGKSTIYHRAKDSDFAAKFRAIIENK